MCFLQIYALLELVITRSPINVELENNVHVRIKSTLSALSDENIDERA